MAQYELTFILSSSLTEAKQKTVLEKLGKIVEREGGKIVKEDKWGKRHLAYQINKQQEGSYFFWQLELPKDKTGVVNRAVEVEEDVLRHLLIAA